MSCLVMTWFTNTDLARDSKYPVFEVLKNIAGSAPTMIRGRCFLNDQLDINFRSHRKSTSARYRSGPGMRLSLLCLEARRSGCWKSMFSICAKSIRGTIVLAPSPFAVSIDSNKPGFRFRGDREVGDARPKGLLPRRYPERFFEDRNLS